MRRYILDQNLLLAAKAAPNARLDHPDALDRKPQHRRQHAPDMKRHLGAGADDQAVIFIPVGHRDMRLDMRLLHLGHPVIRLKDALRLSKAFFYIANIDPDLRGPVDRWIRISKIDIFRLVMQHRRPGCHRLGRVDDRG